MKRIKRFIKLFLTDLLNSLQDNIISQISIFLGTALLVGYIMDKSTNDQCADPGALAVLLHHTAHGVTLIMSLTAAFAVGYAWWIFTGWLFITWKKSGE